MNYKAEPSQATAEGVEVLSLQSAGTVTLHANVEYIERSGVKRHLQILLPSPSPAEKMPLIVYVQGSAWHKQNVFMNIPQLSRFAARGFAIAVVEYRESDIAPFPAQMQDCKTAVRYMRKNAGRYGIDPDRIALWGDSSGGHTVLMAGITGDGSPDTDAYGEFSCKVSAIVDYFGPTDVADMCRYPSAMDHSAADSPEGFMIGRLPVLENPKAVKAANPAAYVSKEKDCPPVLILHGDTDPLVPFEQSLLIYEALRAADKAARMYKLTGAGHGTGEFWTDEVYGIVEAFLRGCFVKP